MEVFVFFNSGWNLSIKVVGSNISAFSPYIWFNSELSRSFNTISLSAYLHTRDSLYLVTCLTIQFLNLD